MYEFEVHSIDLYSVLSLFLEYVVEQRRDE